MPMVISAYTVETDCKGFHVCSWPATSKAKAMDAAKHLSILLDPDIYPNAFWVMAGNKPIAKYYNGKAYKPNDTI